MTAAMDFARAVVAALDVPSWVVCPGSRSGPLAHALAEASGPSPVPGAPALDVHVRIDERVAAFTALGLALGGAPAAVVTTSGTAVGNLLPATMEAHHSAVPLLLVTADRPARLRGTGANQTTDQRGPFGPFAATLDVPAPATGSSLTATAAGVARWAHARLFTGPVHLNLQFDDPLDWSAGEWPTPVNDVAPPTPVPPAGDLPPRVERGVVVAGAGAGDYAWRLAAARGWPLLAEPSSGARFAGPAVPGYAKLLTLPDGAALAAQAELVVTVGRPTLHRVTRDLAASAPRLWAVLPGPAGGAPLRAERVVAAPDASWWADANGAAASSPWLERWLRAADAIHHDPAPAWDVESVAAATCATIPRGVALVVGSSRAVRALDATMPAAVRGSQLAVYANRGLAGIDGTVATATGVALSGAHDGVVALVGDLTFLHDVGALLVGPLEERPRLRVVVLNDGGGTIFGSLEHAKAEPARFERVFTTPHGVDLAPLCAAYGVPHVRVGDAAALAAALSRPVDGFDVVEVALPGARIPSGLPA